MDLAFLLRLIRELRSELLTASAEDRKFLMREIDTLEARASWIARAVSRPTWHVH